jgi:hypothetical protein
MHFSSIDIDRQNNITKGITPEGRSSGWNINCEAALPTYHLPRCKPITSSELDKRTLSTEKRGNTVFLPQEPSSATDYKY